MLRLCLLLSSLVLVALAQSGDDFPGRFMEAQDVRRDQHFYCQGYVYGPGESLDGDDAVGGIDFPKDPAEDDDVWTLWLQYPIIQFIDVTRKQVLFSLIADIIRSGATTPATTALRDFSVDNICLGPYRQIDVYEYSESVILYIYFRGTTALPLDDIDVVDVVNAFNRGLGVGTLQNANDVPRVVRFRSEDAIFLLGDFQETEDIELRSVVLGFHNNPPGSFFSDRSDDPTFNAVIVGSFPRRLSRSEARDNSGYRGTASNPNPINYGLEAGDYIFAIFGGFFLLIVAVLTVLGYFIDPFFLNM